MKFSRKRYTEPDGYVGDEVAICGRVGRILRISTVRRSGWTDAYVILHDGSKTRLELGYIGKRVDDAAKAEDE